MVIQTRVVVMEVVILDIFWQQSWYIHLDMECKRNWEVSDHALVFGQGNGKDGVAICEDGKTIGKSHLSGKIRNSNLDIVKCDMLIW